LAGGNNFSSHDGLFKLYEVRSNFSRNCRHHKNTWQKLAKFTKTCYAYFSAAASPSGKAEVCKTSTPGSNPGAAFISTRDNFVNDLLLDQEMMQRCIALARQGEGRTAPNPMVGAVVVKDGLVVGAGFHPGAGQPHAEVFALRQAGELAQGATIYVSLEPCNHYGRTPPCSDVVIAAGIRRVVVGMVDPNPLVAGSGLEKLRQAGIEVVSGVETAACEELNEAFAYRMRRQQPLGILKYAMTLDGKIATDTGHSTWVSSAESRAYVHHLRSTCDAIVTGGNTLRQDNPFLTSHQVDRPNPLRVVLSPSFNLPATANLWDTTVAKTLVVTGLQANVTLQEKLRAQGVEILLTEHPSPLLVMQELFDRGCLSVLWECGGTLAAVAIQQGAVQKILAFVAPKIVGGSKAPQPVGDLGIQQMTGALNLNKVSFKSIGKDLLVQGYLDT
jgi:diaminohydroxyphosphoribosylaminopyrimidine deaminase / 5-amino-6-(5-phosphoribosylamino)uracil reductase